MLKQHLGDKYPIYTTEISKSQCCYENIDAIVKTIIKEIEVHPTARFISIFDHFEQTQQIAGGHIAPEILAAKLVIFCFGKRLEQAQQLAVRPRSIGIAETINTFIISFLEAPTPGSNDTMVKWVEGLDKNCRH